MKEFPNLYCEYNFLVNLVEKSVSPLLTCKKEALFQLLSDVYHILHNQNLSSLALPVAGTCSHVQCCLCFTAICQDDCLTHNVVSDGAGLVIARVKEKLSLFYLRHCAVKSIM